MIHSNVDQSLKTFCTFINPLSIEASVHPFQQIFKRSQFSWQVERHEIIFEIETLKMFEEMKKHLQL